MSSLAESSVPEVVDLVNWYVPLLEEVDYSADVVEGRALVERLDALREDPLRAVDELDVSGVPHSVGLGVPVFGEVLGLHFEELGQGFVEVGLLLDLMHRGKRGGSVCVRMKEGGREGGGEVGQQLTECCRQKRERYGGDRETLL